MATHTDEYWYVALHEEAARRRDQPSFHVFAEGMHSDVRGQIFNLPSGAVYRLPSQAWPRHVFIVIAVAGQLEARFPSASQRLQALSQVVIVPGQSCELTATTDATFEVISFYSEPPTHKRP